MKNASPATYALHVPSAASLTAGALAAMATAKKAQVTVGKTKAIEQVICNRLAHSRLLAGFTSATLRAPSEQSPLTLECVLASAGLSLSAHKGLKSLHDFDARQRAQVAGIQNFKFERTLAPALRRKD